MLFEKKINKRTLDRLYNRLRSCFSYMRQKGEKISIYWYSDNECIKEEKRIYKYSSKDVLAVIFERVIPCNIKD